MNDMHAQQALHLLEAIRNSLEKIAGELAALREQQASKGAEEREALERARAFVGSFKGEAPAG